MFTRLNFYLIFCFSIIVPTIASADITGGQISAIVDDETVSFPLLKSDISVDIQGDLSTVTIEQTFVNPLSTPVHATYLFPLNKDGAVFEMIMDVGDERIRAQIMEREEAEKIFEQAKSEGNSAALLEQQRPNVFTQEVANLMPNLPIKTTLRYVQVLPRVDDQYQLVLPLVVGPRYQPQNDGNNAENLAENNTEIGFEQDQDDSLDQENQKTTTFGEWELSPEIDYPLVTGVDLPETIDEDRVSIIVKLNAGMLINQVNSDTHYLNIAKISDENWEITLQDGRIIDNKDYVLNYSLASTQSQASLLAHRDERGGFFSLLVEPPLVPAPEDIIPREMVFVLDSSGSMNGLPMDASKAFMREALNNLRNGDSFRIIRFSDATSSFSNQALPANSKNINAGIRYIDSLNGSGGTEMLSGIRQALSPAEEPNTMRIVVFLTDGYIGNESTVLEYINENIGAARIFAFGVGTAVNRYLLAEIARTGRGFVRYMDPTEDVGEVSRSLAARLQTPVLTDISIDWQDLAVSDVNPNPILDLFAGQSLRIMGRFTEPGTYSINVHGNINGRKANLPILVELAEQPLDGEAIALVWARSKIKHYMEQFSVPRYNRVSSFSDEQLKQEIIQLGLDYSLVTQWTSFVAVSERVYNSDADGTDEIQIPLPQVDGVSTSAYPATNNSPAKFSGHSAPEPSVYASTMILFALLYFWFRRRSSVDLVRS